MCPSYRNVLRFTRGSEHPAHGPIEQVSTPIKRKYVSILWVQPLAKLSIAHLIDNECITFSNVLKNGDKVLRILPTRSEW